MNNGANGGNFDLDRLLTTSQPRRQGLAIGPLFLVAVLFALLVSMTSDAGWVQALLPAVMAGSIIFAMFFAARAARRQREEMESLRLCDEAMRLGRWDELGGRLLAMLSSPFRRIHTRFQALIYLGTLLNRWEQHDQAIRLCDYLLESAQMPDPIAHSIRCARAYALLREDRLVDAYAAISQLRRTTAPGSARATILEMYRLVKMGHHQDALDLFESNRDAFAGSLGHRSCDAWALAATAAANLNQQTTAEEYRRNAVTLSDKIEIARRFPECALALRLRQNGVNPA